MKNIFKFLGIALMASAMMVACGDPENENPTDTTPTVDPTPTIADGWKVTFDGNAWTPDVTTAQASASYGATLLDGRMDNDNAMPEVSCLAYQYGQGDADYVIDANGYFTANGRTNMKLDYYDATALYSVSSSTGETTWFGDWWGKEATLSIKAFDATALTMTAVLNATMYDALGVFVNQTSTLDNAATKTLEVSAGNITFQAI